MKKVTVIYHHEPEGWWAESPECPGYSAAGSTLGEVKELVREGLPFHEEAEVDIVDEVVDVAPGAA